MSTGIEWTDETWNPVVGCSKVSSGCDNCYAIPAAVRVQRMSPGKVTPYNGTTTADGSDWTGEVWNMSSRLQIPLHWRKPRKVFVNSMSDLFHPDVTDEFIAAVFSVMANCPQHTFQILTKRPKRMQSLLARFQFAKNWPTNRGETPPRALDGTGISVIGDIWPLPNVWLGVSIESDKYSWRADHLRNTPAAVRWISAEPLLGPLDSLDLTGIDWVVVGGETGKNAREMDPGWAVTLAKRCVAEEIPFFMKQLGSCWVDHKNLDLFPSDLRVREYPEARS